MAEDLGAAVKRRAVALRDLLNGQAGIPTSLDPGSVQVPGAWVSVRTFTPTTMTAWTVRFHIFLIAGNVGTVEALDKLGDLLTKALTVIEPDEPIQVTSTSLPHTPSQLLPAYLLTVDELVEADEE